jgi:hypothetical protein
MRCFPIFIIFLETKPTLGRFGEALVYKTYAKQTTELKVVPILRKVLQPIFFNLEHKTVATRANLPPSGTRLLR